MLNETAFNTLCNIAQTVAREQNIMLEMVIDKNTIVARVVPIEFIQGTDEEDEDE